MEEPPLPELKKHPRKKKEGFSPEEDQKIRDLVTQQGSRNWNEISQQVPGRTARQCRERWNLYLSPDVKNDPWPPEDEAKLFAVYCQIGPKWTLLARLFPNRTPNNVKNKVKQSLRRAQKNCKVGIRIPAAVPQDHPHDNHQLLPELTEIQP
jgi:hypothetical protein